MKKIMTQKSSELPALWKVAELDPKQAAVFAKKYDLPLPLAPVVAQLHRLGHPEASFQGGLEVLEDDTVFDGQPGWELSAAAALLKEVAGRKGRVYLHGDSDTDGITATLVVERALLHYFPHERVKVDMPDPLDHYGFGMKKAEAALAFGADVIITMDCGTNNTSEVQYVHDKGAKVIVLDHHELDQGAPYPAALVVNGKVLHKSDNLMRLSSGGLAWRLSAAVHKAFAAEVDKTDHGASLAYVALSTVVDVVPLVGDNRILVKEGLKYLNDIAYATPALKQLRELAGVAYGQSELQSFTLGFKIGPLLNLGKRLPSVTPQEIYDLLAYEKDPKRIGQEMVRFGIARQERREQTSTFRDAALRFVESKDQKAALIKLAVVRNCPRGIVGLVAQNVAQHYKLPSIVLTDDPSESELPDSERQFWYGSGRSPLYLDFLAMVNATGLAQGHGHAQAVGGIRLKRSELPAFKEAIWAAAQELAAADPDLFAGKVTVTAQLPLSFWTYALARKIEDLVQPTGQGNPVPLFASDVCSCVSIEDRGRFSIYTLEEAGKSVQVRRLGEDKADSSLYGKDVRVLYEVQTFRNSLSIVAKELVVVA